MEKDLILNGKKYISSRRAGALVEYTSDYVGQLCRGGKIKSTLLGKTWFVEEDSILEYKRLQVANQMTQNGFYHRATQPGISPNRDAESYGQNGNKPTTSDAFPASSSFIPRSLITLSVIALIASGVYFRNEVLAFSAPLADGAMTLFQNSGKIVKASAKDVFKKVGVISNSSIGSVSGLGKPVAEIFNTGLFKTSDYLNKFDDKVSQTAGVVFSGASEATQSSYLNFNFLGENTLVYANKYISYARDGLDDFVSNTEDLGDALAKTFYQDYEIQKFGFLSDVIEDGLDEFVSLEKDLGSQTAGLLYGEYKLPDLPKITSVHLVSDIVRSGLDEFVRVEKKLGGQMASLLYFEMPTLGNLAKDEPAEKEEVASGVEESVSGSFFLANVATGVLLYQESLEGGLSEIFDVYDSLALKSFYLFDSAYQDARKLSGESSVTFLWRRAPNVFGEITSAFKNGFEETILNTDKVGDESLSAVYEGFNNLNFVFKEVVGAYLGLGEKIYSYSVDSLDYLYRLPSSLVIEATLNKEEIVGDLKSSADKFVLDSRSLGASVGDTIALSGETFRESFDNSAENF